MKGLSTCGLWMIGVLFFLHLVPAEAHAERTIGVLLFSDATRYQESLKGIREQLSAAGYREPSVRFVIGNAKGNKAEAAELVKGFAAAKHSLMITLGTNATIAVAREIKDVPIVFSMVYDPIEARLAKDWKRPGTNVTGASAKISMVELVCRLKEIKPTRRVAVLYTPGEKNSEFQLKELQQLQESQKINVIPVIVASREDISRILPDVIRSVDAVYLSGSSVIGAHAADIVGQATNAGVISITHLEDLVREGVMLGVVADPYKLGQIAGKKAVAILKGSKPDEIPIEYLATPGLVINKRTAKAAKIKIPASIMKQVTRVYE